MLPLLEGPIGPTCCLQGGGGGDPVRRGICRGGVRPHCPHGGARESTAGWRHHGPAVGGIYTVSRVVDMMTVTCLGALKRCPALPTLVRRSAYVDQIARLVACKAGSFGS